MSENQGAAQLKIGPLACTPPEGHYNNTLQLRIKANEDKSHNNEEALTTTATKADLKNLEVSKKSRLTATQTAQENLVLIPNYQTVKKTDRAQHGNCIHTMNRSCKKTFFCRLT